MIIKLPFSLHLHLFFKSSIVEVETDQVVRMKIVHHADLLVYNSKTDNRDNSYMFLPCHKHMPKEH